MTQTCKLSASAGMEFPGTISLSKLSFIADKPWWVTGVAVGGATMAGYFIYRHWYWSRGKYNLPDGTVGYPLIGETGSFLYDTHEFMSQRMMSYGHLFKSYLFTYPSVCGASLDFVSWFQTQERLGKT